MFYVVRLDNGPTNPPTAIVSKHHTRAAAENAIAKANRKLRSQPGYSNAWHPCGIRPAGKEGR